MLAELTLKMKDAAGAAKVPANPTAAGVWGFSLSEILQVLLREALELGRECRDDIEQAAKSAVDAVVAFDLPLIPVGVENTLDEATRSAGYAAIVSVLDAILGKPKL
jgi:hypothetical protein